MQIDSDLFLSRILHIFNKETYNKYPKDKFVYLRQTYEELVKDYIEKGFKEDKQKLKKNIKANN